MIERSMVFWKIKKDQLPTDGGDITTLRFPYESAPMLLDMIGADRQIVSHALTPMPDGDVMLSLFVERR